MKIISYVAIAIAVVFYLWLFALIVASSMGWLRKTEESDEIVYSRTRTGSRQRSTR